MFSNCTKNHANLRFSLNYVFQAYCPSHTGRSEPSFGRRRRDVNGTLLITNDTAAVESNDVIIKTNDDKTEKTEDSNGDAVYKVSFENASVDKYLKEEVETPSHVRKMIEVKETAYLHS